MKKSEFIKMKKKRSSVTWMVIAILCIVVCVSTASAQIQLTFNPELGKKYEYRIEAVQNITQAFMEQEIPMKSEISGIYISEIKDKTTHEIHTVTSFQEFNFLISASSFQLGYSSNKPNENPSEMDNLFEKLFSSIINQPFTVVFAPNGSVISVSGMEDIIKNMFGAVPADAQVVEHQVRQMFSDEIMKNMFEQSSNFYPERPVNIGDSWNVDNTTTMNNMSFDIKSKYTLAEINDGLITLEVTGEVEMSMLETKISGTQSGKIIVDSKTGMPVESDIVQDIKGTIATQGMDISMYMKSETKVFSRVLN